MRTTSLSPEDSSYIRKLQQYPSLSPEEEVRYTHAWREKGDKRAQEILINAHMKLVVKMTRKYRGYGFPAMDLISQGAIGLTNAVDKFDPERGFRLSTYASWWIRASIQEYILDNWSLVKIGTTADQKKLFFNLNRLKSELNVINGESLTPEQALVISIGLDVPEREVHNMNQRLTGDTSLNTPIGRDGESQTERMDFLQDEKESHEDVIIEAQEKQIRLSFLRAALEHLAIPDRSKDIFIRRQLKENPETLQELADEYHVSRERVRQIEQATATALKKAVLKLAAAHATSPALPSPDIPQKQVPQISGAHPSRST